MGYVQSDLKDAVGRKWAKRIGICATCVFLWLVVSAGLSIWPFSVARDLSQKVVNANSIIYNYEWFYDQWNQIQATRANLFVLEEGSVDYNGTVMVLNQMISEYNSNSSKITRKLWKPTDGDLPHSIPLFTGEKR